jgi:hypothetical protein
LQIIHIHPDIFFTVVERLNALSISHALKTMHMEQANVLAIIMYMVPTLLGTMFNWKKVVVLTSYEIAPVDVTISNLENLRKMLDNISGSVLVTKKMKS